MDVTNKLKPASLKLFINIDNNDSNPITGSRYFAFTDFFKMIFPFFINCYF